MTFGSSNLLFSIWIGISYLFSSSFSKVQSAIDLYFSKPSFHARFSFALMIGPHLQYLEDEMKERCEGTDVKVILMNPEYYSVLNGEKAIDHLLSVVGE